MTSQYRHRRLSAAATPFPSPIEPGEIQVNTANRQLAVGDASAGTAGVSLPLLATRYFDTRGIYAVGDYIVNAGVLYRTKTANGPGAFSLVNFDRVRDMGAGVTAAEVTFAPAGSIASTNVQAALTELDGDIAGKAPIAALPVAASSAPLMDGTANAGTAGKYAAEGHVHPTDTSRFSTGGGTLSGDLTINKANPSINLDKAASGQRTVINARTLVAGVPKLRWRLSLSDDTPEAANGGSDFVLSTATDLGGVAADAVIVRRKTGLMEVVGDPVAPLGVATKQYAESLSGGAVRYDTIQNLTSTFMGMGRYNIYAATFDAMAYSGIQINGACEVSQETGTADVWLSSAPGYIGDGWVATSFGLDKSGATKASGFGGTAPTPPGLTSFVTSWNNAAATVGVDHYWALQQSIEGYRCARLAWGTPNAQPVTICFWVLCKNTAGTFSGSVRNAAGTRSYPFSFNIAAVNTWEYKVVSLLGDTSGVWDKTSGVGMNVSFTFMAGTSVKAPAFAWAAGNFIGANGSFNAAPNPTVNYVCITGLMVLPGGDSPTIDRSSFIQRSYDNELAIAQRYFEIVGSGGSGMVMTPTSVCMMFRYAVRKRATPNVLTLTSTPGIIYPGGYVVASAATHNITAADGPHGFGMTVGGFTGLTVGYACGSHTADWLKCNARL